MTAAISEGYAPGCIGRITELHATYYARHCGFGVAFETRVARELAEFCARYQSGRDGLWLAHAADGSGIQASIAIDGSQALSQGARLRWFITSDAARGLGLGRALLTQALAFVDRCGYPFTHLSTFEGLDAARHLYELHGFQLVNESPGRQWGTPVLEQRFERR